MLPLKPLVVNFNDTIMTVIIKHGWGVAACSYAGWSVDIPEPLLPAAQRPDSLRDHHNTRCGGYFIKYPVDSLFVHFGSHP